MTNIASAPASGDMQQSGRSESFSGRDEWIILLITIHTSLLIGSNAAGAKMIALPGHVTASVTVLSYIASFVILDAIAELFGRNYSQLAVKVGVIAMIISVGFFQLSILLPPADFWPYQKEFELVLGSSYRILIGGLVAYFISQQLDFRIFFRMKQTQLGGRYLWARAWAATMIGQLIDTAIFVIIAFYGSVPLLRAIAGQFLVKTVIATFGMPLLYLLVWYVRGRMDRGPAQRR
jgi:queuosine precursor transporter